MSNNEFDKEQEAADKEDELDPQERLRIEREKLTIAVRRARKMKAARDTAERNLNQRNTAPAAFHRDGFDPTCVICNLAHVDSTKEEKERAKDIRYAYITGLRYDQIRVAFDVPTSEVKRHAKAHGWKYEKAKNVDEALALIIRKGTHNIITGEAEVDTAHLLETIKHIDKREGRIIDKTQNENTIQVLFTQEPLPITPAKNAREAELLTETKSLMLPASSVEVLDAPAEQVEAVLPNSDGIASTANSKG